MENKRHYQRLWSVHYATYGDVYGTKVNDWKCDLTNKTSKSFQLLLEKFLTAMVYSNENKFVDYMTRTTTSHLEEARKKGPADVEKMAAEYPKP